MPGTRSLLGVTPRDRRHDDLYHLAFLSAGARKLQTSDLLLLLIQLTRFFKIRVLSMKMYRNAYELP